MKLKKQIPNILSLLRGFLALSLPYFILSVEPRHAIIGTVIFAIGSFTDYIDGKIARHYNIISSFGKIVDPITDKMLILIPLWYFSGLGFFSIWFVIPVLLREVFVTIFRLAWAIDKQVVAAEQLGKVKFCLQVSTVGFCFLYLIAFRSDGVGSGESILKICMTISLVAMVFISLISGFQICANNKQLFLTEGFAKFVSGFGVGLLPKAPGTWGSLLTLPLVYVLSFDATAYLCGFIVCFLLGYWSVNRLDLKVNKDPSFVTLDEVCGVFVTFWGVTMTPWSLLIGFCLFRVFDIFKPFPVNKLEKVPGFWGIMLDDLGAGVYALIILTFLF